MDIEQNPVTDIHAPASEQQQRFLLKRVGSTDGFPVPTPLRRQDRAGAWAERAHEQTETIPYDSVLLFSSIIF